jgi:MFS family permease
MTEITKAPAEARWGPVHLNNGVSTHHMSFYVLGFMITMLLSTFVPQAQPYILTEILNIPAGEQGTLSGYLGLLATLVAVVMPGIWGSLSDRTGRRLVYAIGFILCGLGIFLTPLAGSIVFLYLYRMIFAAGSNAGNTMSNALLADYVDNRHRGMAFGMTSMAGGIGALLTVFLFLRLPAWLLASGVPPVMAGRYTYWIVAGVSFVAMLMVAVGLQGKNRNQTQEKRPLGILVKEALNASANDPAISLAFGINFVASGAITVVGTFFSLWIVTYATTQAGLNSVEALSRAGMIIGISQTMGLLGSPFFGILSDKVSRILSVTIAMTLTALFFLATILIGDPLSSSMILLGLLLGFVQISGLICGGALIAQQTPQSVRGSVMGLYGFMGSLGAMVSVLIGGFLFDRWMAQGPFILVSLGALLAAIWGAWLYAKQRKMQVDHG